MACMAWALTGCNSTPDVTPAVVEEFDRTLDFGKTPVEVLGLQVHSGQIILVPGTRLGGFVRVQVASQIDPKDEQAGMGNRESAFSPSQMINREGRRVDLAIDLPPGVAIEAMRPLWYLTVPADVAVELNTTTAAIKVRDFVGSLQATTRSGTITARLAGGQAKLCSESGTIDVRGDFESLDITVNRGRARIGLPRRAGLEATEAGTLNLRAHVGSGRLTVEMQQHQSVWTTLQGARQQIVADAGLGLLWNHPTDVESTLPHQVRVGRREGELTAKLDLVVEAGDVRFRELDFGPQPFPAEAK